MQRTVSVVAAAALAAFAVVATAAAPRAAGAADAQTVVGRWGVYPVRDASDAGRVLELAYEARAPGAGGGYDHARWSFPLALGEIGISDQRLHAPIGPVAFRLTRAARAGP